MIRSEHLANRLKEVYLDGKWIANTNYHAQIIDVSWKDARIKIHDLNSIALLIFHINYYLEGLIKVFDGGKLEISDSFSFNMPEITSEKEWNDLKLNFLSNAEAFCNKVKLLDDNLLDMAFVDEKYGTYLRNIEAVIEHSYYHLGQVVLIKKMIIGSNN